MRYMEEVQEVNESDAFSASEQEVPIEIIQMHNRRVKELSTDMSNLPYLDNSQNNEYVN